MRYKMGNCLRGYFEGNFESIEEAWSKLSYRFNLSFPSNSGRYVYMEIYEQNRFGFEEWTKCKDGITEINKEYNKEEILEQCKLY